MIEWTKARHTSCIIGSIGSDTFEEKEHFYINKVKPPSAPKWRHQRITKREWSYEYTLFERRNGETRRVGVRYPTVDAAKKAAEQQLIGA